MVDEAGLKFQNGILHECYTMIDKCNWFLRSWWDKCFGKFSVEQDEVSRLIILLQNTWNLERADTALPTSGSITYEREVPLTNKSVCSILVGISGLEGCSVSNKSYPNTQEFTVIFWKLGVYKQIIVFLDALNHSRVEELNVNSVHQAVNEWFSEADYLSTYMKAVLFASASRLIFRAHILQSMRSAMFIRLIIRKSYHKERHNATS